VHKGLLLIFVPLLVQLLFFVQLFNLVNQAEALGREQANRAEVMEAADQFIMEFGTTWTVIICKLFLSHAYKLDPEAFKTHMDLVFARVRPLTGEYRGMDSIVAEAQQATQEQYDLQKEVQAVSATPEANSQLPLLGYVKLRSKFARSAARGVALKQIVENEISTMKDTYRRNEDKRVSLKKQIFIGVAADFTVTVLLLFAFLWDITKRLKMLVANAYLLPTGKALNERVSGSDELAMLDGVLHDASEELQKAKDYRKSLTEMVAHDLRSPLSSARSTVDLLLNPGVYDSGEQSLAHLAKLRRSLIQLTAFVEDLLTIDRLESRKLELELSLFKIHSLIDETFDSLAVKAQSRDIKLVKEGADSEVVADQSRIAQVVMNLLTNAIKHSPDGGTVRVLTRHDVDTVKLSVIDQGKGIAESERERIFQKFVQNKDFRQQEGFGLGLAICKLIIDAHRGTIGLKSKVSEGSEFWFTLPGSQD
jgi:signal transduction histidine kinase